ncbi:glutamate/tyrosine decarboxylase-like PLP-dependent enzyme [Mumia flava]|uniref:Glutamate/tyrosine decarboxylase-like PLP-dependent enzyme n=1 Tax=Mumia flava TaxID=1348852 RepID=A0A0B2BFB6_9ACTN|nr:aminotransferase class V-fold PLP-dependent enzyme [Mumia flava]PJJ48255.1 glutamate/tyrosine decarboxylase-like PLP-dependent enzyme [Mumia flava]
MDDGRARALETAHENARRFLAGLDDRPVWPRAEYDAMLEAFGGPLPAAGADPAAVVDELARIADPGLAGIAGGRFFGFVIGGELPAALGADWLTSVWDQNGALTSLTPAAAAAETAAVAWLVEALGLPTGTVAGLVTGGMMANFTCLAAARHQVLADAGWDVAEQGLVGGPWIRVVVGKHRHDTVDMALRYLGIGRTAIVEVATDDQGRILPEALSDALSSGGGPTIVCLQAGEVHTGAFDPFPEAIALAREAKAWVHVDGAFGLWAAASEQLADLTRGVAEADSWATDAHKTLNVPYDCGLAFVRDATPLTASFGIEVDYLIAGAGDPLDRVPEFSRRARGFTVWAALRSLGRDGLANLVETLAARAARFAEGAARIPGVEVVNDVVFTQVMVRLDDDARTAALGRQLLADGTAVLTPAVWDGRAAQRFSVSSWSTSETDVDRTVEALARAVAAVS